MSPGPRPTSVPSGILMHPTICPQYTNVTDRHNGPVALITCNGRPKTKIELETAIKMEVTMVALIPTMCQLTATWSSNKLLSCCTTKKSYCLHDINAVTIHLDCTEYLHHYSHPALHRICKRSAVGTKQTTEDKNKLPTTGCRLSNYSSKTKWCILWLDQMLLSSSCKTETSNITVHITVASNFL